MMKRYTGLVALMALFLSFLPNSSFAQADATPFGFKDVVREAQNLAQKPYEEPHDMIPKWMLDISYDEWRDIRFRPEKSIWRDNGLPFELQMFHPGLYYDRTVKIWILESGVPHQLKGFKELFDYGKNTFAPSIPEDIDAAGFRAHTRFKNPNYADEFLVFLGASYLRAVGKNHHYGMSARGLAVDTAAPNGEEFPWFKEFWITKPAKGDKNLQVYALLDSPSVTGAYEYVVTPGKQTVFKVKSMLFPRTGDKKFGIAPLTSMYYFGENMRPQKTFDYRPEVHDSDGLLIAFDSGEWLWRPLINPSTLQVNAFSADNIRGFGLLQRDVSYESYLDLEAMYEDRPSVWIEPEGDWGKGHLELVLIPTEDEIHDNIVAYWVPEEPITPGQPMRFDYTMTWHTPDGLRTPGGYAVSTRTGAGKDEDEVIFVVEFYGLGLRKLPPESPMEAVVNVGNGAHLVEQQVFKNPETNTWRMAFRIKLDDVSALAKMLPEKRPAIELRAFLKNGPDVVTETWSYLYLP